MLLESRALLPAIIFCKLVKCRFHAEDFYNVKTKRLTVAVAKLGIAFEEPVKVTPEECPAKRLNPKALNVQWRAVIGMVVGRSRLSIAKTSSGFPQNPPTMATPRAVFSIDHAADGKLTGSCGAAARRVYAKMKLLSTGRHPVDCCVSCPPSFQSPIFRAVRSMINFHRCSTSFPHPLHP